MEYDIIVVGAGHAGIEAALATSKLNKKTLLLTSNLKNIADMPCNPSIGGSAKGIIVREIDALGGQMGITADKTILQMKMLNLSKGPAVRSLRAQVDKVAYKKEMIRVLENQKNLFVREAIVNELIIKNKKVIGVITEKSQIFSKIVILTTGTYLGANILVGSKNIKEGPDGKVSSTLLSESLEKNHIKLIRLKTGTPPRIEKSTVDFNVLSEEKGDDKLLSFSHNNKYYYNVNDQVPCHLTYTNFETHKIIKENLKKSSMYSGRKEKVGIGPRYCPSIEDKIIRFFDKPRHQLFLEPESLSYDDIYLQGFSTSMPENIQEKMVHSLKGLEKATIKKHAYAIEYDAIETAQTKKTLESKIIENLFTAGQINGTSGYEEAAAQGIIAGINAVKKIDNNKPLVLLRNEAYIGVLIDDLITKGITEPYRMLTSRAEHRLLLRNDNADIRLSKIGYDIGLLSKEKYTKVVKKQQNINELTNELKVNKIYDKIKRPEEKIKDYKKLFSKNYDVDVIEQTEIEIKYEGYIKQAKEDAKKMEKLEKKEIPKDIDYSKIINIATEGRQRLEKIRPNTIGEACRVSGVNPSDIMVLNIYLKRHYNE